MIDASPETIYRVASEIDFSESWIIYALMRLRGMSGGSLRLKDLNRFQFEMLGEIVNREMVIGLIGRFWTIGGGLQATDAASFKKFDTAGYAKAVWNFSLQSIDAASRLTTETRIKCLDADSRRSFGRYWTFIQPFSGIIRMEMLKMIKHRAETGA
jgi:hypothetical protein